MSERPSLGQILMGFGRLTEEDVARALAHQRKKGGYFGEALLALHLVSPEELEFSLASQFDLPYVFPEADSIDPDAAALVTPEWALANLTLPIMRSENSVTVILDSPMKTEAVDELSRLCGLEIELALASPAKIRELIRQVYAKAEAAPDRVEAHAPLDFADLALAAVVQGSPTFGISVRGHRATGWFMDRAAIQRRLLSATWSRDLDRDVAPAPSEMVADSGVATWSAQLSRRGFSLPVEVRYVGGGGGAEYVFEPVEGSTKVHERFPPPSTGVLAEVQLLVASGSARFAVSTEPAALIDELLPYLPVLFLDPYWRSAHLCGPDSVGDDEVFRIPVPGDPDGRTKALEAVRGFRFDAVTAALDGPFGTWADRVSDVAGVVFLPVGPRDRKGAEKVGIRWELQAKKSAGGRLEWTLQPLKR